MTLVRQVNIEPECLRVTVFHFTSFFQWSAQDSIKALQADAEACVLEQVISEYRKARSLMDSMGAPSTKSVWHKLFTEVEVVRHQ